ncbi:MAG: hypothetical protein L3K23_10505 [Thermoplasmata archaeon]|nr:hypothetical protein [Thermoplasmata archaeon]
MPKSTGTKSATPPPNEPAPTGSPSAPATPATLDLSKYRREAAAPAAATPAPSTAPQREQYPLVAWSDLGGIDGLMVVDVWAGQSEPKPPQNQSYAYVGANLKFPDGAMATALTGSDTVAGSALTAALNGGTFDKFLANGEMVPVPVHVRNRPSRPRPDPKNPTKMVQGRPMSFLTFG